MRGLVMSISLAIMMAMTAVGVAAAYTVQSGDTLSGIAADNGVTTDQILELNDLANPNLIYPGQEIVLPGDSSADVVEPAPTLVGEYTVERGDTLVGIAAANNTTVQAILDVNDIPNPRYIYPGQLIQVPGAGSADTVAAGPASRIDATIGTYYDQAPPELQDAISIYFPVGYWEKAARVSFCESSWNPYARLVTPWEDSRGYFQINTYSHRYGNLYNPYVNVEAAYEIWANQGGTFSYDWITCSRY